MSVLCSRFHRAFVSVGLLWASACGRGDAPFAVADAGTGGSAPMEGGSAGAGGGGSTGISPPSQGDASPPGTPAYELAQKGLGACADSSLVRVIAAVHQGWPALADVTELYRDDPNRLGDGSFIYAFANGTGFALVFM